MHGNVAEWCNDWSGSYDINDVTDPQGAAPGLYHIIRGGSWINWGNICRSAFRLNGYPEAYFWNLGFRIAASL